MNNIMNLHTERQVRRKARAKGVTLCRSGFHKWKAVTERRFDVRQGQLITTERCTRCPEERTRLS
jgi:hypothetical protein